MIERPRPKKEIVANVGALGIVRITYASEDARSFAMKEAASFGSVFDQNDGHTIHLYTSDCYDAAEVARYILSYND